MLRGQQRSPGRSNDSIFCSSKQFSRLAHRQLLCKRVKDCAVLGKKANTGYIRLRHGSCRLNLATGAQCYVTVFPRWYSLSLPRHCDGFSMFVMPRRSHPAEILRTLYYCVLVSEGSISISKIGEFVLMLLIHPAQRLLSSLDSVQYNLQGLSVNTPKVSCHLPDTSDIIFLKIIVSHLI